MPTQPNPESAEPPLRDRPPHYHSYLLRFWEARSEQPALSVWRFSLEDPQTMRRYSFADLEALCEWLQARTRPAQESG